MTRQTLPREIDDRYQLGDLLGTGGSGAVYRALDRQSGSQVALKVLHQPLESAEATARFEREVAAHQRVNGAPGVVRVHGTGIADRRGWLAMDLHATTLRDHLASVGTMSPTEVIGVLHDAAVALEAIHQAGVLHRDLKPSNVFMGSDGHVVLADLGIAKIDGEATLTGMTPLSLQWAAPETIETGESSVATDIYSLGTTAFTLLSGRPPFEVASGANGVSGSTVAVGPALRLIAAGERPQLDSRIPEGLRSLVDDMMAVDPRNRPASASEIRSRLQTIHDVPNDGRSATASRRTRALIGASAAVAVAVVAGIFLLWPSTPKTDIELEDTSAQVTSKESASVATSCEGAGVWCEPLALSDWTLTGDPQITTYAQVDTDFGPAFRLTPGPASGGGHSADRSIPGIGSEETIALRLRVLVDEPNTQAAADPQSDWFQSIATLSDERGSQWSLNLFSTDGELTFNASIFAPDDFNAGAPALRTHAFGEWHCVEFLLDSGGGVPAEMLVNGESLVTLAEPGSPDHGVGFLLSLGPRWLEGADVAPQITISDVVVGDEPVGC